MTSPPRTGSAANASFAARAAARGPWRRCPAACSFHSEFSIWSQAACRRVTAPRLGAGRIALSGTGHRSYRAVTLLQERGDLCQPRCPRASRRPPPPPGARSEQTPCRAVGLTPRCAPEPLFGAGACPPLRAPSARRSPSSPAAPPVAVGGEAIGHVRILHPRFSAENMQGCLEMTPPPTARPGLPPLHPRRPRQAGRALPRAVAPFSLRPPCLLCMEHLP